MVAQCRQWHTLRQTAARTQRGGCHRDVVYTCSLFLIPPWFQLWAVLRQASPQLVDPVFILLFVAYNVVVHGAIQYVNFHYGLSFYAASILTTDQVWGRRDSCHLLSPLPSLIYSTHPLIIHVNLTLVSHCPCTCIGSLHTCQCHLHVLPSLSTVTTFVPHRHCHSHLFAVSVTIHGLPLQVRLSMKSYSFIRENAYKVLYPWKATDTEGPPEWYKGQMKPELGSFRQFMYFSFAPTLLYRDEYPRQVRGKLIT